MSDKIEIELLELINSIPKPPIFGVLIVENGMVKLNKDVISYFKHFDIDLKKTEPVEKVEKLCKEINCNKYLMVVVI